MKGLLAVVFVAVSCQVRGADIDLSPNGAVCSPAAAILRARELRSAGIVRDRSVVISVRPGRYEVDKPLVLTPEDSGIRFVGQDWSETVFDGGRVLPLFRDMGNGFWEADVPAGIEFEQLWVNGRRAQRARSPNRHYFYMKEQDFDNPNTSFFSERKDTEPLETLLPGELAHVVVGVWQSWDMGYGRVKAFDKETGRLEMTAPIGRSLFFWDRTRPRYVLENFRAALDEPGEWFFDEKVRKLLYVPLQGEVPSRTVAVVPVASGIVELKGNRKDGKVVRDVSFSGITFEHTAFRMDRSGQPAFQSVSNVGDAAIRACGAENISIENCRIAHVAMHGIWLRGGCRNACISHCLVEDLGAGGVYFGDTRADFKNRENNSSELQIKDSIVRHGGRMMNGGIGVWIGMAHNCSVVHNDIYDFLYTGVSTGWTWGYAETVNRNIKVNFNRIHHIGQGVLSDIGAFYSLGDHTGSEVLNNWIWEVKGYAGNGSPAWGLYTDEGSKGILIANNLVERCRDGAVHQHYGKDNVYSNNVFATFDCYGVWRSRAEDHVTLRVCNNIFWWTNKTAGAYHCNSKGPVNDLPAEGNVYWCSGGSIGLTAFNNDSWGAWRKGGMDATGTISDPLFANPLQGDWALSADSPAVIAGFRPFDWRAAGIFRDDARWARIADEQTWDVFRDAPQAPVYCRERAAIDFEKIAAGVVNNTMGALSPLIDSQGIVGSMEITKENVRQGRHALLMREVPNLSGAHQPMVRMECRIIDNVARICFSVRGSRDCNMSVEVRDCDTGPGYLVGAVMAVKNGHFYVAGDSVADLAENVWADIELEMILEGPKKGQWICTVRPQDGSVARTVTRPTFYDARFKRVTWIGFISYGPTGSSVCLDDIRIQKVALEGSVKSKDH